MHGLAPCAHSRQYAQGCEPDAAGFKEPLAVTAHAQKNWSGRAPVVSYHRVADDVRKVHLHELENDLIGGYNEATRTAPELQFSGGD